MAREKSPAFSYYPKDLLSDDRALAMTGETFGCYWWLVSICWLRQSLPDDEQACAALCRGKVSSARRFAAIWPDIRACFVVGADGLLRHGRLDRERDEQAKNRQKRKDAADKRWRDERARLAAERGDASEMHAEDGCNASALQCLPTPTPSASAGTPPIAPLSGGFRSNATRVLRRHRKQAEDFLHVRLGRCPHEPRCAGRTECLATLAGEMAAREREAADAVEQFT